MIMLVGNVIGTIMKGQIIGCQGVLQGLLQALTLYLAIITVAKVLVIENHRADCMVLRFECGYRI